MWVSQFVIARQLQYESRAIDQASLIIEEYWNEVYTLKQPRERRVEKEQQAGDQDIRGPPKKPLQHAGDDGW